MSIVEKITLRGLVFSRFSTVSEFSNALGWKNGRAGRILRGEQEMNVSDIVDIASVLEIDDRDTFENVFFPQMSTKWTSGNKKAINS